MLVKRDYEVELVDRQANDEVYELVEVFNFENDTLQGIFESKVINYHDFYIDDNDDEIEINAKIKVRIKASVSLDTPYKVNEYSLNNLAILHIDVDSPEILEWITDSINDYFTNDKYGHYSLQAVFALRLNAKEYHL